jgi:hypothetical protein
VKRSSLLRAAVSALLPLLACSHDLAEQEPTPDDPVARPDAKAPGPQSEPEPTPPEDMSTANSPCMVDADCDVGHFCELRICVAGCDSAAACDAGEVCDPHGRCAEEGMSVASRPIGGIPTLDERTTVLAPGETHATTTLRNDGPSVLVYRLAAASPALAVDAELAELAPGEEVSLAADVDLAALGPADRVLPVQVITSGGAVLWSLEFEAMPESGSFRGAVSFEVDGHNLGQSALAVDLDFRADGTIAGRVDNDASLLWPQPLALTGTWTPDGNFTIELRDLLPADDWRHSPISRDLGRVLTLTGTRTAEMLGGTATMTLTGMRETPVQSGGGFTLRRQGPLEGLVLPPDFVPEDAPAPPWLAPPGLDTAACDGLGTAYGTDDTLALPEPACDTCAVGNCSAEDMMGCGMAIHESVNHLPDVLAALQGDDVQAPEGPWTWDECTADSPIYQGGVACLDITALQCADALLRRGSAQVAGPWGEALRAVTANFAAGEANAVTLLSIEAQVDAAFAYKDELGEPVPDALSRELAILAADRERLAAALAPMLAPAYATGLEWLAANTPDPPPESAHLAPLEAAADYARATVAWSRVAHRAGKNPDDLRAAIRLAAIAMHATAAELHARLADIPAADAGLHALGPALAALQAAHDELAPGTTPFGYPAAYVPLALSPEDIAHSRTNFEAVQAFATDEVTQFGQLVTDAWQQARDYEQKVHTLDATAQQIETEYNGKLRALCGSLPGETEPALAACGEHGGHIADLRAAVAAADLRIRHATQASENNLHAIAVEEERFAREVEIHLGLTAEVAAAQGQIFQVKDQYGEQRGALQQAEARAECMRISENESADQASLEAGCNKELASKMLGGPTIFFVPTPDIAGMILASKECDARQAQIETAANNQCESVLGQAGLQNNLEELQRGEDEEIMAINAEVDQAIRESSLESQRASSVALIKNLRAEGLLLAIEVEEAQLARSTAMTAVWSTYQEVAALAQEKARAVGLMVENSPDNVLTRPHFLAARLAAASRVLPARERTTRRVYLALRALEYEVGQELPALRDSLAVARAPEDFTGLMSCMSGIAEDYRLQHGYGQPYVTEVSLRADLFGITDDVPDVDGSPATPAEQFAALLQDPLHALPDGSVALPFTLSAFKNAQFSSALCDDRIDKIEVKLVGDFLGDKEAEVILTRQGLAGVRRCDAADLPHWSAYVPYSFDRAQLVVQAGVNDWGTAGPNAGFAAWPVHGEQWTLTIPSPEQAPANLDLDLAHVSDVVLRLHHRAGTIAPDGQGSFTPDCG